MQSSDMAVGLVTFWTLNESNLTTIKSGFESLGLEKFVPEPPTPMSALKTALLDTFPGRLIRKVRKNGFCVVAEEQGEEENDYRPIASAIVGDDGSVSITRVDDWEQRQAIRDAYENARNVLPANNLSITLSKVATEFLGGTPLRPSGGIYWMRHKSEAIWRGVAGVVEASARKTARTKNPSTVYLIRHDMDVDSVRAVRDAVVSELTTDVDRIRREIQSGELGERALHGRTREALGLCNKLKEYEQILGVGLDAMRKQIEEVETAAAEASLRASASASQLELVGV
jgi:hypothetical protein